MRRARLIDKLKLSAKPPLQPRKRCRRPVKIAVTGHPMTKN